MMTLLASYLLKQPLFSIFLVLCLGYLLGKVKIKTFTIGSTVGVLVIGLLIGQLGQFSFDATLKNIFFDLFIFTIGYEVGPAFINSLKKSGLKLVVQSIFFAVISLITALILFNIFHVNKGEGAGIVAGALTQSAVIGTATSAINSLGLSANQQNFLLSQTAIAYALTYVFGTVGVVIFLKNIAPKILGVNLKEATKDVIEKMHYSETKTVSPYTNPVRLRGFAVKENSSLIGKTILALEKKYHQQIIVEEVIRQKQVIDDVESLVIEAHDQLILAGRVTDFIHFSKKEAQLEEIAAEVYQELPLVTTQIVLTQKYSYHALEELLDKGVLVLEAKSKNKTVTDYTALKTEDHVTLLGTKRTIATVLPELGYEIKTSATTNIPLLSLGLCLGVIIGGLSLTLAGVPLGLGQGGACLFAGLFLGWYQGKHQNLDTIPAATGWFLKSVGLNLFIGCIGLESGAKFIPALKDMGWQVLLLGILLSIIPHLVTLLFGKFILKLNPVDNIGSLTGAGTITAALNAISEETESSIFALAYTPAYAVGNILITILGPLIVYLLH